MFQLCPLEESASCHDCAIVSAERFCWFQRVKCIFENMVPDDEVLPSIGSAPNVTPVTPRSHGASLYMCLQMQTSVALVWQSNRETFKRESHPKSKMFRANATPDTAAWVLLSELQAYSDLLYESLLSCSTELALRVINWFENKARLNECMGWLMTKINVTRNDLGLLKYCLRIIRDTLEKL